MIKIILSLAGCFIAGFSGSLLYSQWFIPWRDAYNAKLREKDDLFNYVAQRGITLQEFVALTRLIANLENNPRIMWTKFNLWECSRVSDLKDLIDNPETLDSDYASYVMRLCFNSSDNSGIKKLKSQLFYNFAKYVKSNDVESEEGGIIPHVL